MLVLFISLFFIVLFDARLLSRKDPARYHSVMGFPAVRSFRWGPWGAG